MGGSAGIALDALASAVERRLALPLPGGEGQSRFSPRPRFGWQPDRLPPGCRDAAALLLLYPVEGEPHMVLTLRRADLPNHAGQVSLPGGVVETGEGRRNAALRETEEEIGVPRSTVRVLGPLSPLHIPVSRFILHPVVGVVERTPVFRRCEREVERILQVSLRELLDPGRHREERREHKGTVYDVPYLKVAGERVWGATAMILAEWIAVLEELDLGG